MKFSTPKKTTLMHYIKVIPERFLLSKKIESLPMINGCFKKYLFQKYRFQSPMFFLNKLKGKKSKKDSTEDKRVQRTKKKKSSFSSSMQEDESITSESTHFRLDDQVPFGNFNVYISESKVGRIKFNLLNRY